MVRQGTYQWGAEIESRYVWLAAVCQSEVYPVGMSLETLKDDRTDSQITFSQLPPRVVGLCLTVACVCAILARVRLFCWVSSDRSEIDWALSKEEM